MKRERQHHVNNLSVPLFFASTMDLHNNNVGINTIHTLASGLPDRNAIKEDLTKKYTTGEMYIWEIPKGFTDVKEDQSEGIIIKSNLTRVFP